MRVAAAAHRTSLRRSSAGVAAALAAAGLLAGCTGGGGTSAAPDAGAPLGAASPVAATAPAPAGAAAQDLSRGLLPAADLAPGATVQQVTLAQLQQQLAAVPGGLTRGLAGVQITPSTCATALEGLGAGLVGVSDMAGEAARTGAGGTAEGLVTGTPVATAVDTLRSTVAACRQVQVTSPHGSATVTLEEVPVPSLGDSASPVQATAVQATAVLTPADRAPVTVSGLLAVVRDGDRLLLLGTAAPGTAAPDRASFTSLLTKAFDTESSALG
jgi:hypothetical protein